MPDDPGAAPDGSTATPLEDLESPDVSTVMRAAVTQVKVLTRAARLYHRYVVLLAAACALQLIVIAVIGYLLSQQASFNNGLRQSAINACHIGNKYRAEQVRIWDEFITLVTRDNHDPAELAKAHAFLAFVRTTDAQNNCERLYGAK